MCISENIFAGESGLYMPRNIEQAYQNRTRSHDGNPGENYWQNSADYEIQVELDPIKGILSGSETITYFNSSPDSLDELVIHLFPNIYRKGNSREFDVDPSDETDGVLLKEISIDNRQIDLSPHSTEVVYLHNDLSLFLQKELLPEQNITLYIRWQYSINKKSHMRTGRVDSTSYFIAYFFPRIAVYDDIDGWNRYKYSGRAEFYNDFGNYNVSITVPENYVVWATGLLSNPEKVLTEKYQKRWKRAARADTVVHIVSPADDLNGVTQPNPNNTWIFAAENVTDFAFAVSDHYLWDATSLIVDLKSGRRVLIEAAYNKNSRDFYKVAQIAKNAIEYMSYQFPAIPFPFPSMTIFNGLDEMEYPMMVNDISSTDPDYTIKLTSHEIFHSYLPFYMGINETQYAWMDEGWATFADYLIYQTIGPGNEPYFYYGASYKNNVGLGTDIPIYANSIMLKKPAYHHNAYAKPAIFLYLLKDLLGDELFLKTTQEFMYRWHGKHPIPHDFFYTLNQSSGQNLNWLIKPWFFEFGYVDLGIEKITADNADVRIMIKKTGLYPAPIHFKITFADGTDKLIHKTAAVWKNGQEEHIIIIPADKKVIRAELMETIITDADPSNNIYVLD
jgi:hypothetical protein